MIVEYSGQGMNDEFALLFFYASYLSSCNHNINILNSLANRYPNLRIIKINVTKHPISKEQFKVKVIPTFIIFNNKKIISKIEGAQNQKMLFTWISQYYNLKE